MFSDMLFTAVCPLNDLQRFVVFKIILIFCTVLSFDYAKRIAIKFEDFIKKIDFSPYGAAIKTARTGQKESRNKVGNEMYLSPRYLANIENNGQHPSLQIFFELMLRYNISVDQFLLDTPTGKDTKWRQLDALLDDMSDNGIRIVTATAKEISEDIKITKL